MRIIGGKWKKRRIRFQGGSNIRPTPNVVRETLFNWLSNHINGANCLDLFAGSGALGVEAISRGAQKSILIDKERKICHDLKRNASALNGQQFEIYCAEALHWLDRCNHKFDIVFLDPPFGEELIDRSLKKLAEERIIKSGALVYIECNVDEQLDSLQRWRQIKQKITGQVSYSLIELLNPS